MMFVARDNELSLLKEQLRIQKSSLTVVYGRRRIGKTETIRHFITNNNLSHIEVTGVYGATKLTQINSFVRKISRASQGKISSHHKLKEWQDVFFLLEDYLLLLDQSEKNKKQINQKKIIFLDEFPWLDTHRSGFLSAFSEFWNDFCTRREDIVLIICGSAASYMINKVIKNNKTLHNRVTHKLNMLSFNLKATKQLLQAKNCHYSNKSIVDLYIALGGVAKYIIDIDCTKQPIENITFQCFNKNGLLITEYQEIVESLFKNSQWHYKVMNLLSTKWSGYIQKDIAIKLNTTASVIKDILEELELSGFISSVTKFRQKTRDKIYRATDSFSYFYNKWMKYNRDLDWQKIVTSQPYKIWSGFAFENICHIHSQEIKQALGISGINSRTHYWQYKSQTSEEQGAQIDMLLEYTDGSKNIDIIECKYHDSPFTISKKYYHEIKTKIAVFNEKTKYKYNIRVIFISVFGILENAYYNEIVQKQILIDDLM